ncbi:MAG TPA: FMN-binding protein [Patescibacteria group bacterium]
MKKYFQITVVLGLFGLLVLFRQFHGRDEQQPIIGNANNPISTNPTAQPAQQTQNTPSTGSSGQQYKDGTYTGSAEDAYYGNIQIQITITSGKIVDVAFLQYPSDNGTSQYINSQAMPLLKNEALQAQSANVDIVSGASDSSQAFQRSLSNALQQAKS